MPDSGYTRYKHNDGRGASGMDWSPSPILKDYGQICKLLSEILIKVMPHNNLLKFIKETEFKFKITNLNDELKTKELFDVYLFLKNVWKIENKKIFVNEKFDSDSD